MIIGRRRFISLASATLAAASVPGVASAITRTGRIWQVGRGAPVLSSADALAEAQLLVETHTPRPSRSWIVGLNETQDGRLVFARGPGGKLIEVGDAGIEDGQRATAQYFDRMCDVRDKLSETVELYFDTCPVDPADRALLSGMIDRVDREIVMTELNFNWLQSVKGRG